MGLARKFSKIGMIIGSATLLVGVLALVLPLVLIHFSFMPRNLLNFDAHPATLDIPMMAWMIGAPIGTLLILFGAPTSLVCTILYFVAWRTERRQT